MSISIASIEKQVRRVVNIKQYGKATDVETSITDIDARRIVLASKMATPFARNASLNPSPNTIPYVLSSAQTIVETAKEYGAKNVASVDTIDMKVLQGRLNGIEESKCAIGSLYSRKRGITPTQDGRERNTKGSIGIYSDEECKSLLGVIDVEGTFWPKDGETTIGDIDQKTVAIVPIKAKTRGGRSSAVTVMNPVEGKVAAYTAMLERMGVTGETLEAKVEAFILKL